MNRQRRKKLNDICDKLKVQQIDANSYDAISAIEDDINDVYDDELDAMSALPEQFQLDHEITTQEIERALEFIAGALDYTYNEQYADAHKFIEKTIECLRSAAM